MKRRYYCNLVAFMVISNEGLKLFSIKREKKEEGLNEY